MSPLYLKNSFTSGQLFHLVISLLKGHSGVTAGKIDSKCKTRGTKSSSFPTKLVVVKLSPYFVSIIRKDRPKSKWGIMQESRSGSCRKSVI